MLCSYFNELASMECIFAVVMIVDEYEPTQIDQQSMSLVLFVSIHNIFFLHFVFLGYTNI
jgi:hypothetical protein